MIDRAARDEAIAAIEEFLDDGITAFEFDDRLQSIETDDATVGEVISAAWFHYDDCKDHQVVLSKKEWDYFQRLLLLLRSDAEISSSTTKRWSWDHAIAWVALATFVVLAIFIGWGVQLLVLSIPFGAISLHISRYRQRKERSTPEPSPRDIACTPYESYSQIRWLRERAPNFVKRPYREEIADRRIRSDSESRLNSFLSYPFYLVWILLSPIALLFQGFADTETESVKLTQP